MTYRFMNFVGLPFVVEAPEDIKWINNVPPISLSLHENTIILCWKWQNDVIVASIVIGNI